MGKRTSVSCERFIVYLEDSGMKEAVSAICKSFYVSPRDIYLDARGWTITAARLETWWWMMTIARKSMGEVARIFDRDSSSLYYSMQRLGEMAVEKGVPLNEKTIHAIAEAVAQTALENARRAGRSVATSGAGTAASVAKRAITKKE